MRTAVYLAVAAVFVFIAVKKKGLHFSKKKEEGKQPLSFSEEKIQERYETYPSVQEHYEIHAFSTLTCRDHVELENKIESCIELSLMKLSNMGCRYRVEHEAVGEMLIVFIISGS